MWFRFRLPLYFVVCVTYHYAAMMGILSFLVYIDTQFSGAATVGVVGEQAPQKIQVGGVRHPKKLKGEHQTY